MDFKQPRKMYPGMWKCPRNPDLCCIYRVPTAIREVNPEAYTPQLVLIGPLHHSLKSKALKALDFGDDIIYTKSMGYLNMEEHKKNYLVEFAERVEGEKTINEFRRIIEREEETIRESYSESTVWIQSPEFVEMVLHDSVFIIEFILRRGERGAKKKKDPLGLCLREIIFHDLMLLENQLPYFIMEKLFDPIFPRICRLQTFREVVICYFNFEGKIRRDSKFRHFTDLFRCVRVETLSEYVYDSKPIEHMYNASKLEIGGINFKVVGEEFSLNVRFEKGCLKMAHLMVMDTLETELRNIMALEQCHYILKAHVCNYVLFLDYLIDTDKDVDLLVEKGIIQNWMGQPALVSQMVNKLSVGILHYKPYYSKIVAEVNTYYKNPVNRSKAVLKRVYFGNLWTGTATIAAMCLLVMTLIQTWASVTQVKQN